MKQFALAVNALFALLLLTGCASMQKHKYVFFGPAVGEKVDIFEDYWTDAGPFKPDDASLKLRRGKAGVIRFFKKDDYVRSVRVDGSLIVYVFHGGQEGIELTKPQAQLVLSPEQLEKHRKYDKKIGHTYHVWLDLGEADLPEEEISILSVFTDSESKEQKASDIIRTIVPGSPNPEVKRDPPVVEYARLSREKKSLVTAAPANEGAAAVLVQGNSTSTLLSKSADSSSDPQRTITTIDLENRDRNLIRPVGATLEESEVPSFEEHYKKLAREALLKRFYQENRDEDKPVVEANADSKQTPTDKKRPRPGTFFESVQGIQVNRLSEQASEAGRSTQAFQSDSQSGQFLVPSQAPVPAPSNDLLREFGPSESASALQTEVRLSPLPRQNATAVPHFGLEL
ncbi:MAG: hypothetical protein Q4G68_07750 [Planctomycetia bacterium]|nr:hypothetical protein [Planctomycetia bacterium]